MIKCIAIDDDPLFLKMIQVYFREMKSARLMETFTNPVEGIMAVVKAKPDVLLLDYEMPYLDGIEALETMDRPPKVIVISGHQKSPVFENVKISKFIPKMEVQSAEILEKAIVEITQ